MKSEFRTALAVSFALFCLSLVPIRGQDPSPQPIIRANVEVVHILCTVRDKRGEYVDDLTRDDFQIIEDGVAQEVEFFSYETGDDAQPLTVTLLMDTSGSVKDKLRFEQEAASEFFQSTLRKNKDLAAIIQFDSEINLVQDFTFDFSVLEEALMGVEAGGATKLYDAIFLAVDQLLKNEAGRRVMVVLSDGRDTNSTIDREEAIRAAQESDVVIFGIGVKSAGSRADFGVLKDFARSTGGAFFKSNVSLQRIREAFKEINAEIKNQYSLGYISSNKRRDGSFRELQLKVNRRGLKLSHRKGYYAPRPFSDTDGRE